MDIRALKIGQTNWKTDKGQPDKQEDRQVSERQIGR